MYPKELMTDLNWGFYGGKYESREKFICEVTDYNNNLDNEWIPDEIVLSHANVTIQYSWWDEGEDDDIEEDFNLVSDSQLGFTAAELLYKIHNHVVDKLEDVDHHFFEGLTLFEGENYSNPNALLYFLNQGS
jgi:hypothetical protein